MVLGMAFFVGVATAVVVVFVRTHPGFREALGMTSNDENAERDSVEQLIDPYTEPTSIRLDSQIAVDPQKAILRAREGLERIQLDPSQGLHLSSIARDEDLAAIIQMPWVNLLYLRSLVDSASEMMRGHNHERYARMSFEKFDPEHFSVQRDEQALAAVIDAFIARRTKGADLLSDDVDGLEAIASDLEHSVHFCMYVVTIFGLMVTHIERSQG